MHNRSIGIALSMVLAWTTSAVQAQERIVALTPDVADIIVALNASNQLVGRDKMATTPQLKSVPEIGFSRALTVEPILAVKPTLALGSAAAIPNSIYTQLNRYGVKTEQITQYEDGRDFAQAVVKVGKAIGQPNQAATLSKQWQDKMKPMPATGKRYLLSYDGKLVAGKNTAADYLIKSAGGINAAGHLDGFKPLNREAWLAAKPDVILVASHNQAIFGSIEKLATRPELINTPAAKFKKIQAWPADRFLRVGINSPNDVQSLRQLALQ